MLNLIISVLIALGVFNSPADYHNASAQQQAQYDAQAQDVIIEDAILN